MRAAHRQLIAKFVCTSCLTFAFRILRVADAERRDALLNICEPPLMGRRTIPENRRDIPDRINQCTFHNRQSSPIPPKADPRGRGSGGVARQPCQKGKAITRYAYGRRWYAASAGTSGLGKSSVEVVKGRSDCDYRSARTEAGVARAPTGPTTVVVVA